MTQNAQNTVNAEQLCEFVHQRFVDKQKTAGLTEYRSHDDENIMVPWAQLSTAAQNRYREYCQWHLDGIQEQTPKTKGAGS